MQDMQERNGALEQWLTACAEIREKKNDMGNSEEF